MAHKQTRLQQRGRGHSYVQFPHHLLRSTGFQSLSGKAVKALLYLAAQYIGHNNGDLGIAWKVARTKGWKSNANLRDGIAELLDAGFIELTRQGGRNRCSLYALTWFSIDECDGKLDVRATRMASNHWRLSGNLSAPPAVQCAPPAVQSDEEGAPNRQH